MRIVTENLHLIPLHKKIRWTNTWDIRQYTTTL